jgi:hypothetical protein
VVVAAIADVLAVVAKKKVAAQSEMLAANNPFNLR